MKNSWNRQARVNWKSGQEKKKYTEHQIKLLQ